MEIPGIGEVTKNEEFGWYCSDEVSIPVLRGQKCRIAVKDYEVDESREDFHVAIDNFLSADVSVLRDAEPYIFQYYEQCKGADAAEEEFPDINSPGDIWTHVQLGENPVVTRRAADDQDVYVSVECGCDWEPEHGLQIVFKNGREVNKVGPYDGHVTNADAYADERLNGVIFRQN